jgi:PHYB activation tagged suppressor 1
MTLGKLNFTQGMELMIPILDIHHDQALLGDNVNELNPRRFASGAAQAAKHPLAFIPLGVGPRTCIGRNFTMFEAMVALAMIFQCFSFLYGLYCSWLVNCLTVQFLI